MNSNREWQDQFIYVIDDEGNGEWKLKGIVISEETDEKHGANLIFKNGRYIGLLHPPHKMDGERDIDLKIPGLDTHHAYLGHVEDAAAAIARLEAFFA